jgi:hypothetical protein
MSPWKGPISSATSAERFNRLYQKRQRSAQKTGGAKIGRRPVNPLAVHEYKGVTRNYKGKVQHSWTCTCGKYSRRWWDDETTTLLNHQQHASRAERSAKFLDSSKAAQQKDKATRRGCLIDEHW